MILSVELYASSVDKIAKLSPFSVSPMVVVSMVLKYIILNSKMWYHENNLRMLQKFDRLEGRFSKHKLSCHILFVLDLAIVIL